MEILLALLAYFGNDFTHLLSKHIKIVPLVVGFGDEFIRLHLQDLQAFNKCFILLTHFRNGTKFILLKKVVES